MNYPLFLIHYSINNDEIPGSLLLTDESMKAFHENLDDIKYIVDTIIPIFKDFNTRVKKFNDIVKHAKSERSKIYKKYDELRKKSCLDRNNNEKLNDLLNYIRGDDVISDSKCI